MYTGHLAHLLALCKLIFSGELNFCQGRGFLQEDQGFPSPAEGKTEASFKDSQFLPGSLLLAKEGISWLACTRMQGQEEGI